jgi:hypothetical protein
MKSSRIGREKLTRFYLKNKINKKNWGGTESIVQMIESLPSMVRPSIQYPVSQK